MRVLSQTPHAEDDGDGGDVRYHGDQGDDQKTVP